jgi:hypothetical protein
MNEKEEFLEKAKLKINTTIVDLAREAQKKGSNYYEPFMLLMRCRFDAMETFRKGVY